MVLLKHHTNSAHFTGDLDHPQSFALGIFGSLGGKLCSWRSENCGGEANEMGGMIQIYPLVMTNIAIENGH